MTNDPISDFYNQRNERIASYTTKFESYREVMTDLTRLDYEYNFDMLGRPIIQMPQDIVAIQEIIWSVKPDLIIETGIAHGGSLMLSASMLALLDMADAIQNDDVVNVKNTRRKVLGVDIDIRAHNRAEIEKHPMSRWIDMIQGSSISDSVVDQVKSYASRFTRIMVFLDSNHTHDHVLAELNIYAPLTTLGSYCVVFDTNIEDLPEDMFPNRPWAPGNSPKTAVHEYLSQQDNFVIDKDIQNKLLITVAPDGYLKRVR